jgi:hypothetical protein
MSPELPSLEEIADMEQQQARFIAALEIDHDKQQVRCQGCGDWKPIEHGNESHMVAPRYQSRIEKLRIKIKKMQQYNFGNRLECIQEEEELRQLLEEQQCTDILRRIPLYSSSITGYRFLCSICFDKLYLSSKKYR